MWRYRAPDFGLDGTKDRHLLREGNALMGKGDRYAHTTVELLPAPS
jgi:hypothetical protein